MNLGYTQRERAVHRAALAGAWWTRATWWGPSVNTKLATMDQLEPIYVYFNLNERDTLQAVAIMRQQGMSPREHIGKTPVFAGLQNQEGYPQEGTLDFADTGISTSSGTMQLRAVFRQQGPSAHRGRICAGADPSRVDPSRCWSCRRASSAMTRKAITCWRWMRMTSWPGGSGQRAADHQRLRHPERP